MSSNPQSPLPATASISCEDVTTASTAASSEGVSSSTTSPPTATESKDDTKTASETIPEETINTPGTVQCRTTDGGVFEVEIFVMRQSRTFNKKFPAGREDNDFSVGFDVPEPITKELFEKVIDWCAHHKGLPEPVVEQDANTQERKWFEMNDFEKNFFETATETVCRLISCGELLDIKRLFLFGCQAIAGLIKGKTPEQIREILGIEDDVSKPNPAHEGKKLVWMDK